MEFETKKAGTLTLCKLNQQALLDIIMEMGGVERLAAGNVDLGNAQAIGSANRLLTYAMGWGVENEAPAEALETLEALGKPTHLTEIARAAWLRYLVLDNAESSDLIAAVMKLAFEE